GLRRRRSLPGAGADVRRPAGFRPERRREAREPRTAWRSRPGRDPRLLTDALQGTAGRPRRGCRRRGRRRGRRLTASTRLAPGDQPVTTLWGRRDRPERPAGGRSTGGRGGAGG